MRSIEEILQLPAVKDTHRRLALNIMYTSCWLLGKITQVLKPYSLTEPQYNVLRSLEGKPVPMALNDIQELMIQRSSNVSRIIDKLLEKELVTRQERADNRRKVDICITEKGQKLLAECIPMVQDVYKAAFADLKKEKAETINDLFDSFDRE